MPSRCHLNLPGLQAGISLTGTENSAVCRQSIDTPSSVNGALSVRSYLASRSPLHLPGPFTVCARTGFPASPVL